MNGVLHDASPYALMDDRAELQCSDGCRHAQLLKREEDGRGHESVLKDIKENKYYTVLFSLQD